jgi:CMP-N,N'-diacetyllegionaminic acid synthase
MSSRTNSVVAVIPARRGSKGLPLKNLRPLGGVPLIVHSIRAAQNAASVDAVVVSTEDDEIAAVASQHGALVVKRPHELATDTAQNNAVVKHVLDERGQSDRVVVLLQPTSPLRTAAQIDACVTPLLAGSFRSAMTITAVDDHPGKMVVIGNGLVEPFTNDADMEARRQTLKEVFRQTGAVYAVGVKDFLEHDRFYLRPCHAVVVPAADSIDIDSDMQLMLAELMLQKRNAI